MISNIVLIALNVTVAATLLLHGPAFAYLIKASHA